MLQTRDRKLVWQSLSSLALILALAVVIGTLQSYLDAQPVKVLGLWTIAP